MNKLDRGKAQALFGRSANAQRQRPKAATAPNNGDLPQSGNSRAQSTSTLLRCPGLLRRDWQALPMPKNLIESNPYLRDPEGRRAALRVSAASSSAVEGIRKHFARSKAKPTAVTVPVGMQPELRPPTLRHLSDDGT